MTTKTTYIDTDGKEKTGYIKDGKTYTDPNLTTRIPTGVIVKTGGGDYYMGSGQTSGVKVDAATGDDDSFTLNGRSYKTYYNEKGDAFADEGKTLRVPNGTDMYVNGAKYYNDKDLGMVPTIGGAKKEYNNAIAQTGNFLQQSLDAQKNASEVRTQNRLKALKDRERKVNREKTEADRNSYNAYIQAANPYGARAEGIARLGLANSGYGETSLTSLGNAYQQALAGNEKARAEAMAELTRLADEARAEGDREQFEIIAGIYESFANINTEAAKTNAQFGMQAAGVLEDRRARESAWERDDRIRAEENERNDRIRAEENEREDRIRAEENEREDRIRADENAREDRQRAEDRAASASRRTTSSSKSSSSKTTDTEPKVNEKAVAQVIEYLLDEYLTMDEAAAILGISTEELAAMIRAYYG